MDSVMGPQLCNFGSRERYTISYRDGFRDGYEDAFRGGYARR